MDTAPTIATVPCVWGTPWKLEQLTSLHNYPLHTMRLPEAVTDRRVL
jgi:hypothetical protein